MISRCWTHVKQTTNVRILYQIRRQSSKAVISIVSAQVYKQYPSPLAARNENKPLFDDLDFALTDEAGAGQFWAVVSPSSVSRTSLLQVLAGKHVVIPANARRYPLLSELNTSPHHAIKYVGFDADRGDSVSGDNVRGAYLSARYESRREETDYSLEDYLIGHTQLNALEQERDRAEDSLLEEIVAKLSLQALRQMPVANLSNGQTRRARIAKALMAQPEVLLLDGPFMGLDPNTVLRLSAILQRVATRGKPRLIISLRPEDEIPAWVNHLILIDDHNSVLASGEKEVVTADPSAQVRGILDHNLKHVTDRVSRDGFSKDTPSPEAGEAVIEIQGATVAYGERAVLGNWHQAGQQTPGLWWSLRRGDRCGIFGPNGSGKTTMLSLITSDHPQTYGLPVKLFGKSRLPRPGEIGINLFDLQRRMGHSSPEVHAFFPRRLSVRRALESAWADAPLAKPSLDATAQARVDAFLSWFSKDLRPNRDRSNTDVIQWATQTSFGELSFSNQRLTLFLRAIIASPDLVILDEAFSGIDEELRDRALLFMSQGETVLRIEDGIAIKNENIRPDSFVGLLPQQALLVISHAKDDVPGCIRQWICLPEPGEGQTPRTGTLPGPLELNPQGWDHIWGR